VHYLATGAAPGDFVHVPEGGVHVFRNESGEPASMLLPAPRHLLA
jgi:uncharacterized RmlC-like cupin family protein